MAGGFPVFQPWSGLPVRSPGSSLAGPVGESKGCAEAVIWSGSCPAGIVLTKRLASLNLAAPLASKENNNREGQTCCHDQDSARHLSNSSFATVGPSHSEGAAEVRCGTTHYPFLPVYTS